MNLQLLFGIFVLMMLLYGIMMMVILMAGNKKEFCTSFPTIPNYKEIKMPPVPRYEVKYEPIQFNENRKLNLEKINDKIRIRRKRRIKIASIKSTNRKA